MPPCFLFFCFFPRYQSSCSTWFALQQTRKCRWIPLNVLNITLPFLQSIMEVCGCRRTFLDNNLPILNFPHNLFSLASERFDHNLRFRVIIWAALSWGLHMVFYLYNFSFLISGSPPPHGWPSRGEIRIEQVSVRYAENLPAVLKDITVYVRPGEKVSIYLSWIWSLVCNRGPVPFCI